MFGFEDRAVLKEYWKTQLSSTSTAQIQRTFLNESKQKLSSSINALNLKRFYSVLLDQSRSPLYNHQSLLTKSRVVLIEIGKMKNSHTNPSFVILNDLMQHLECIELLYLQSVIELIIYQRAIQLQKCKTQAKIWISISFALLKHSSCSGLMQSTKLCSI